MGPQFYNPDGSGSDPMRPAPPGTEQWASSGIPPRSTPPCSISMINLTMWLYQHDDVVVQWVHAAEQYVSIISCSECVQQSKTKTAAQVPECDHDYEQDGFHACVVSPLLPVCNVIDIIQPRLYLGSSHHIFVSVNQLCLIILIPLCLSTCCITSQKAQTVSLQDRLLPMQKALKRNCQQLLQQACNTQKLKGSS